MLALESLRKPMSPIEDARRAIRYGIVTIALAFGGVGTWAAVAPLNGAVVAAGQVKVESSRKTIQHLEGGIVRDILVKEGDTVKRDQPLIVLEDTQVASEVTLLDDRLNALLAQEARLIAEKSGLSSVQFPDRLLKRDGEAKVADIMRGERRQFQTRRDALSGEISLLNRQSDEAQAEIKSLNDQILSTEKTIGYLKEELSANEGLALKGFVSTPRLLEFKRNISSLESDRNEYAANLARAKQKVSEIKLRIANLKDEYAKQASDELKKTQIDMIDLQERLRVPEDAMRRQTITAPVSGRIVGLRVHTIGGVITPREPLMDIVPENSQLIVESKIRIEDIDDLHIGMDADVRLSAYKRRITPMVKGVVTNVSADSMQDQSTQPPYFLAQVQLDSQSLKDAGDLKLYPGMPAEVYIQTASRTALEYLLEPITDSMRRSFNEP